MFKFSKKGVSIYLALMVMTILLAIGLGLSMILINQIRMIRGMENSVIAFHTADTGIEEIMYRDKLCWQENCPAYCQGYPDACSGLPKTYAFSGNLDTDKSYDASHTHKTSGPLDSPPCYDFNGDGVVTYVECGDCNICPNTPAGLRHDFCLLLDHYGTTPSSPNWDPMYDIAPPGGDEKVDFLDLMTFADQVNKVCDYLVYIFKSVGTFEKTKRAIEVISYHTACYGSDGAGGYESKTTNWGDNLYECEGSNKRCYEGVCRRCDWPGSLYADGLGGMGCWYSGIPEKSCDEGCTYWANQGYEVGPCVPANWNDDSFCTVCRNDRPTAECYVPSSSPHAPYYDPNNNWCRSRLAGVSQSCSATGYYLRYCVCQY